jgi:6-pyruvoyltetrahydropterin/6-carboxytetrahydropterin synthase
MIHLTRRYRFCAGHRLHNEALSRDENQRLYGKCNNPNGHGHNFLLEVTVAGPIEPATGMALDLGVLDGLVNRRVLDEFDHQNLNLDVDAFRSRIPTTENLCLEIFRRLSESLAETAGGRVRLQRVGLEETNLNSFECVREDESQRRGTGQ